MACARLGDILRLPRGQFRLSARQVTTLPLEGEDGPLAALEVNGVVSDRAGDWYVTTADSVLHVSAAGRVRSVATLEGVILRGIAVSPDGSVLFVADFAAHKILQVEAATGAVTTLAGSGTRGSADGVGREGGRHRAAGRERERERFSNTKQL